MQLETNLSMVVHGGSKTFVDTKMREGEISNPLEKVGACSVKSCKASPLLGILQKDLNKGVTKKSSKVGRKKDLEKIKLMGECLVESGFVKTLDSHFSNPPK